jgi:hypothetical protein
MLTFDDKGGRGGGSESPQNTLTYVIHGCFLVKLLSLGWKFLSAANLDKSRSKMLI